MPAAASTNRPRASSVGGRPASAKAVLRHLTSLAAPDRAAALQRFFKTGPGGYAEGDRFLGLTVPTLRRLAREHARLPLSEVRRLLASEWHEARLLALLVLVHRYERGDPETRRRIHALYLSARLRINNWDLVDCSAEYIVGAHLSAGDRTLLHELAASPRIWDRRIAVLATFHGIKCGNVGPALDIAGRLVHDRHDLIHKAVGWMLREIGKCDRGAEEAFLQRHAANMPRTMLRYAIERFPPRLRRQYMKKPRRSE